MEYPPPPAPDVKKSTVRSVVHLTVGGSKIRIRLSNFGGTTPLLVSSAYAALSGTGASIQLATNHVVTFGGQESIFIPPGALALSDAVALAAPAGADLAVSLFFSETVPARVTAHSNRCVERSYVVLGNAIASLELGASTRTDYAMFLAGVDVWAPEALGTIVALGDSITDGGSLRWPALLAERLAKQGRAFGVLNQGIGGNIILGHSDEGPCPIYGIGALARLERDVFSQAGVRYLVVFEGINDIGSSGRFSNGVVIAPERIIAGLKLAVERAHELGVKVYGATLTPFEGTSSPGYYTAEKEKVRQAVNDWIRSAKQFDGFFDFDQALRDPAQPGRLRAEFDSGDHIHPSDAGEKAMSDAIDLAVFN